MTGYSLAVASDNIRIWNVAAGTPQEAQKTADIESPSQNPIDICWSPLFDCLLSCSRTNIKIHDISGVLLQDIPFAALEEDGLRALTIGYKSSRYVYYTGTKSHNIRIYDRKDNKVLSNALSGHKSPIKSISLTTDDQRCLSAGENGDLIIHSMKHSTRSNLKSPFIQFYPFKKSILVAAGDDGTIALWDIHNSLDPWQLKREAHLGPIMGVAFAPCNKHLYCTVGLDKMVKFHDVQQSTKALLHSFTAPEPLTSVSINDDHSVAVGTSEGNVIIYDVRWKGAVVTIASGSNAAVRKLAFQPPKWAVDAATKENFLPKPIFVESTPKITQIKEDYRIKTKSNELMDMFSPVKSSIKTTSVKSITDLRKVALFQNMKIPTDKKVENSIEELSNSIKGAEENILGIEKINEVEDYSKKSLQDTHADENTVPIEIQKPVKNAWVSDEKTIDAVQSKEIKRNGGLVTHHDESDPEISRKEKEVFKSTKIEKSEKERLPLIEDLLSTDKECKKIQPESTEPIEQEVQNNPSEVAHQGASFQYHVLENIVKDTLADFRLQVHIDIQNMHLELLRQFQIQKEDIHSMLREYMPTEIMLEEISRLREENSRLKSKK